jgi:mRNA turnover protein 4
MPKSKRSKVVSLTKVAKKGKEQKTVFIKEVQDNVDKWKYCWLFDVGTMRNTHLQTVRRLWKDSARIFFGKGAVMAKALGTTPEEEHRLGISKLAQQIKGQVGLFFTDSPPDEVIAWFDDFVQPEFARSGNIASRTVILPPGPVMRIHSDPPEPFPHNEEPQLRKLGLSTSMVRGVPTLQADHKVCDAGKVLTAEQAQLLKLIGERMSTFRMGLFVRWDAATGEIVQMDERRVGNSEKSEKEDDDEDDEEEMSSE